MYEFGGVRKNTDSVFNEEEYQLAGYDFILDLLIVSDVLEPLVNLMVVSQKTSLPCWHIVRYKKVTLEKLHKMAQNPKSQTDDEEVSLDADLSPLTSNYLPDICREQSYKSVEVRYVKNVFY